MLMVYHSSFYFFSDSLVLLGLQGATIVDLSVTITPAPDYMLPPAALNAPAVRSHALRISSFFSILYSSRISIVTSLTPNVSQFQARESQTGGGPESAVQKAEDVVSSMLAKGFILGKDAVTKAKAFDEKHQLTSTATAKVVSLDQKIGLTEKISMGTAVVNEKVKEMDQKFQVSEKTKSAFTAAEQTVSNAGSAIMKNRYVFTSASWVTGAFSKVAKAAGEVGQKAKEKVGMAEDEQRREMVDDYARVHLSESPKAQKDEQEQPSKPLPAQGLIL